MNFLFDKSLPFGGHMFYFSVVYMYCRYLNTIQVLATAPYVESNKNCFGTPVIGERTK